MINLSYEIINSFGQLTYKNNQEGTELRKNFNQT